MHFSFYRSPRNSMNENCFDNFSDVELRQELRKYGLPVVPITETTRNLLIKRLKNHVMNESNHVNKSSKRRSLQTNHTPAVTSRRTVSPARRQNPSSQRRTLGNVPNKLESEILLSHSSDRNVYLSNDGMSHLNRDYEHCAYARLGDRNGGSPRNMKPAGEYPTKSSPKIYLPPPILAKDTQYAPRTPQETDRPTMPHNGREYSGVVSRLLKLRDITIRGTLSPTTSQTKKSSMYLTDSDSDSVGPSTYSTFRRRPLRSFQDVMWNRFDIRGKFKQTAVPYLLINCLGLFFLVLAVLYMTKPPDMPSTMLEKSTSFTLCDEVTEMAALARPSINCIDNDLIGASLALNKELIQLLQANTEMHYCKDRSISPEVSGTEFIKYLYKKRTSDANKLLKSFHAAMYLIERNPQWKIQILNKSESKLMDIYRQDVRFVLHKPYLPLKCNLFNKLQRFFLIIGTVFLIAVFLALVLVAIRFVRQRSLMKTKTVENFCKEIRKELMQRSLQKNDHNSGEIIINHLRDKLISINKRKSQLGAWNEALEKLEASDSRIQFGTIMQNGEEFRTMKWLDVAVPISAPTSPVPYQEKFDDKPQKKHWQSPAFDNVNKILDPPTNCLKIRHMFDSAEANYPDLKQSIIESILEKVGSQCRIYDVQLDRQNCCVYIRCASEKDAGIIHNEVNGWWFDNRLVSIKFLRLQRFLMRYPNSTSTTPLTITN